MDSFFSAVARKDREYVLRCFTSDAHFDDPHYPRRSMVGKQAIRRGLAWAFDGVKQFEFGEVRSYLENGDEVTMVLLTNHTPKFGPARRETQRYHFVIHDGLVFRLTISVEEGIPLILKLIHIISRVLGQG